MTNKTWIGGVSGDFNSSGDWSPAGEPGAGDYVFIGAGATVDFTATGSNSIETIQQLQLAAGGLLEINSGQFIIDAPADNVLTVGISGVLQVNGGMLTIGAGSVSLPGKINLLGATAMMQTGGASLILSDFNETGSILLVGGSFGGRVVGGGGVGTLDTFTNLSSLLHGSGYIGANAGFLDQLHLINKATIAADAGGLGLILNDHIDNDNGALVATGGGTLFVEGSVDQTQVSGVSTGDIRAEANSTVVLDSASITMGTVHALDSGKVRIGQDVTLDAVRIDGLMQLDSGTTLTLSGLIKNDVDGTIDGSAGTIVLSGATLADVSVSSAGGRFSIIGGANEFWGTETVDTGFTLGASQHLKFGGSTLYTNLVVNHAVIGLTGPNATLDLGVASDNAPDQLSGGGTVTLFGAGDRIAGTAPTIQFEDIDNTIIGFGSIDNLDTLTVDAGASIVASGGGTLVLNAANIVSAGFLGADPGSTLEILGKLTNTGNLGGLIVYGAPLAGLIDGTLESGGTIVVNPPGAGVDGLTNNGQITVTADAVLTMTGDTDNTGIIQLSGGGSAHPAKIVLGGELSGGGKILFATGDIVDALPDTLFTNVDNLIEGSGNLGTGNFNFQNNGIINANLAGNPLTVDPNAPTVRNLKLMEATAGGTLAIVGDLIDTSLDGNTQVGSGIGTLLADGAGSVVALLGGSVREGLLDSTNGGQIQVRGAETLFLGGVVVVGDDPVPYARPDALTNFSDFQILAGQTLTLAQSPGGGDTAVLNNNSTVSLRGSAGAGATLVIDAITVEIDAPAPGLISSFDGTVSLNNAADRIVGATGAEVLVNAETIAGFGQVGAGTLNLVNRAMIEATDATAPLVVFSAGTFVNQGTLAIGAGAGGNLVLEGIINDTGTMKNFGGIGAFVLGGTDAGGTLVGAQINTGILITSSPFGSTIDGADNIGTIAALTGQTLVMAGQVSNFGTVEVHAGATLMLGSATLDVTSFGSGQLLLDDAASRIDGAAGQTLVIDDTTVSGAGQIGSGQMAFANATQFSLVSAIGTLAIDTGAHAAFNAGTLLAGAGDELDINGVGGVDNNGTISANGGIVLVAGTITGTGVLKLDGGTLRLEGGVSASQTVDITGFSAETVSLGMPTTGPLVFTNFQSVDTIDLENVLATGSSFTNGVLHVSVGGLVVDDLQFPDGYTLSNFALIRDASGLGTDVVIACFAAGTRILTANGEVAVEALRLGDAVVTLHGGRFSPIKWLDFRHIDCRRHPDPRAVWPIRVRAGAFGPATPHADLLLSPDHAVFVDGSLVPIRYLVNGRTIAQEPHDQVTYWHIELARHDVLLAEGLPAESYLDTGNRDAFAGTAGVTRLHPDFAAHLWEAEACAPLLVTGAKLRSISDRLRDRAALPGHAITKGAAVQVRLSGIS